MRIGPLIFFHVLGATIALASAPPLCLQGCCGQALKLPSRELALSSGTVVALPEPQIPCCECPASTSPPAQGSADKDSQTQTPINDVAAVATNQLPPFSILPCPESCPCCEWCEPLSRCTTPAQVTTYNTIRNLIGCESLPEDTPTCPIGRCTKECLCRETLMKQLESALLSGPIKLDRGEENFGQVVDDPEPSDRPRHQPLVPKLPPWYALKPTCTSDCPCCEYCQPLDSGCPGGYSSEFFALPYPAARRAVGCQVHPATTPLCPIGNCHPSCMCRESLLKRLNGIFFNQTRTVDNHAGSHVVGHDEL